MMRQVSRRALSALLAGVAIGALAVVPLQLSVGAQPAVAAESADFDPSYIIADRFFFDANAMSTAEIQAFLDAQVGSCANGACLNVLTSAFAGANQYVSAKTGNLVCSAIPGGVSTTAQFIFQVQQACGISARVILVTLQKEQALITGSSARSPSQGRLNIAMGYACPDTAACDTRYYGVANQIYWGARQLKNYSAGAFFRQPGPNYIQFSPNASCGGTTLDIKNYATAALYNYTPYQPNAASLANLYGTGDGCSTYGNRNFWRLYSDWFGNPVGNSPIGWLDSAVVSGSNVIAKGWAIDIDLPLGAASVELRIDGTPVASGYATQNRPGLGAAVLPAAGDNHGYTLTAPVSPGRHTVCVIGLDSAGAPPATLLHGGADAVNNCAVIVVSAQPVGWIDSVSVLGSRVTAVGWALDPDTAGPLEVRLVVDGGVVSTVTAGLSKPGLAAALGSSAGDDHGYSVTGVLSVGTHTVCVIAVNDAPGPNGSLLYGGVGALNNCAIVSYSGPKSPVGWMDSATLVGSTVTVSGWAIDPDTASAVRVQLVIDGAVAASGPANAMRPGLGAAVLPAAGDAHGYSLSATVGVGQHTVCVVALDDAGRASTRLSYAGANASSNCATLNYAGPKPPVGWMDSATLSGSTLTAAGWAIDPDTAGPIQTQLVVDGAVAATATASSARPGLGAVYPGYGNDHGYSLSATLPIGSHTVCVVGVNDAAGPPTTLRYAGPNASNNCAIVTYEGSAQPVGWIDSVSVLGSRVAAVGWALDPDTAGPLEVRLVVDGGVVSTVTAGLSKPGLAAALGSSAGDDHGYSVTGVLSVGTHTVCVIAVNDAPGPNGSLLYGGVGALNNCAIVSYSGPKSPVGWMDSATLVGSTVTVSGWAIDPDTASAVRVQLVIDGAVAASGPANAMRPGLGAAVLPAAGDAHGYSLSATVGVGQHTVCVVALDDAGRASTRLSYAGANASSNCATLNYAGN